MARAARHAPRHVVTVWRRAAPPSWQVNFANRHNIQSAGQVRSPLTVKRAIALEDGPTILVGHSYGGVVITEAGNDPTR